MVLARAWRRRVYGGALTTVFVPLVLIGMLATLALSGGFGQLTALGQALAGPPAPAATGAALTRAIPRRVLAALAVPAGARRAGVAIPVARRLTASTGSGSRSQPAASPPATTGPTRFGSTGAPAATHRHQPPGRTPHPTVVDGVVSAGSSVTSGLPAPAGPVATKTLQTAGSTVDKILPPVPHTSR